MTQFCIILSCILFISNSMVSRAIWKNTHSWVFQKPQTALVLRTRVILIVFEKLTCAWKTVLLLPIYTNKFDNHASVHYYLSQEVMLLPLFVYLSVCLFVCLSVSRISQKLLDRCTYLEGVHAFYIYSHIDFFIYIHCFIDIAFTLCASLLHFTAQNISKSIL